MIVAGVLPAPADAVERGWPADELPGLMRVVDEYRLRVRTERLANLERGRVIANAKPE
ncbi:MAG: hypothetical protein JWM57_485 [Phycisphaerales bacterium]|nr:hypothetical protein [Phycisphaerales bacterium]